MPEQPWDGVTERRKTFRCPEHQQLFTDVAVIKNTVVHLDKQLNSSIIDICKHIEESKPYREKIIKHDEAIKSIKGTKALVVTNLCAIILAALGGAVWIGALHNQVKVNTENIKRMEASNYRIED